MLNKFCTFKYLMLKVVLRVSLQCFIKIYRMKGLIKYLFLVVSVLSITMVYAQQPYNPMLKQGRTWVIETYSSQFPDDTSTFSVTLSGMININGKVYHKSNYSGIGNNNIYFREDTLERKVYGYYTQIDSEFVHFDFSKTTIYDTVYLAGEALTPNYVECNIGAVNSYSYNGIIYPKYVYYSNGGSVYFIEGYGIEGIGGCFGPLGVHCFEFESFWSLKEVRDYGNVIYSTLNTLENNLEIPFIQKQDHVLIDLSENLGAFNYAILTMDGKILQEGNLHHGENRIDTKILNQGIYLVEMYSNNTRVVKKIVIH